MDIWLDSGLSWSAVLPEYKADLYLEGMDQFRGWFQSSLLTSIALQERSPYRYSVQCGIKWRVNSKISSKYISYLYYSIFFSQSALFVHGFAVDEKAAKMSKSIGNVVDPELITKGGNNSTKNPTYGVDTLR